MEEADVPSSQPTEDAVEARVMENFQKSFSEVQTILNHNTALIREISQNQESNAVGRLTKNVGLIRELNTNIGQVVQLYENISAEFSRSMEEDNTTSGDRAAEADAALHQPSNAEVGSLNKQKKHRHT